MVAQQSKKPVVRTRVIFNMNYQDIYVVEDFDEAEQFRYEHNNQTVEVGTAVAYDKLFESIPGDKEGMTQMICFDGIYYQPGDDYEQT